MKVNVNHPSFISFIENVTNNILSNISIQDYFSLNLDKKHRTQYTVLKLIKSSVKVRAKLTDTELLSFITILWKKNEESENYEFAAILNDISKNFEKVNEVTNTKKRITRKIKTDTSSNG
jgi:hypothetical protein